MYLRGGVGTRGDERAARIRVRARCVSATRASHGDGGSPQPARGRGALGEDVKGERDGRAVRLVVLDTRQVALGVEAEDGVRRVEEQRAARVVAEVAARVHPVLREHREVLGVALAQRIGHGEAVRERIVPLRA